MSYTALYRKFRPLKFEDMVGEDHITKTLKNQIISDKVGHAYLFSGGRGTGKTTSAKILARAVNCLNPQNGEPCNECEICREILEGSLTDVIEMDAASNNSVDDIRGIRDEVNFLPTKAKYRVYIIDEVHMLTTGAFNALLKTLEEPPEHVKFILATTEPQKLPTTILSRCQRFDFKKISDENIIKRLKIICDESQIKISDEALNLIAVLSEGAMRDAISILERCAQENTDEIEIDLVKELVGIPSLEHISKIVKAIFEKDEIQALAVVDDIINEGKDLYNFLWEIIKYLKDVLVYKSTKKLEVYSKEELKQIDEISKMASSEKILNIICLLSNLENDIKWSSQKTIMFQTGIIKACMDIQNDGMEELKNRVAELEKKLEKGEFVKSEKKSNKEEKKLKDNETRNSSGKKENSIEVNENNKADYIDEPMYNYDEGDVILSDEDLANTVPAQKSSNNLIPREKLEDKSKDESKVKDKSEEKGNSNIDWKTIVNDFKDDGKLMLYTSLANTTINQIGDMIIEIEFPKGLTPFVEKILNDSANRKDIEKALFDETGKQWHVRLKGEASGVKKSETKKDNNLGININIIE